MNPSMQEEQKAAELIVGQIIDDAKDVRIGAAEVVRRCKEDIMVNAIEQFDMKVRCVLAGVAWERKRFLVELGACVDVDALRAKLATWGILWK